MPDTISVIIGGEKIELPLVMNFATLERVWPPLDAFSGAANGVARTSAALGIVAALLLPTRPELTVPELKSRLRVDKREKVNERILLEEAVAQLLRQSGLVTAGEEEPPPAPGQAAAAESLQTGATS